MENPKEIKDYEIIEELGSGSYGIVYKVRKKNAKEELVLKQISLIGLQEKERQYIETEAKLLSELNSKYIVKYIDSFNLKNKLNIVMEYCNEGDLEKFLEENKKKKKLKHLNEDLIWKLFLQISIGLAYLHSKRILHRDLKTLNIFLTNNLQVKIGDLGVARQLEKGKFATTFIGTPYYLSPEICNNKEYNEKSDVWALGCILYELCTFKHPFDAKSQGALILKIINEPVKDISNDFSQSMKNLIKLLLEKDDIIRPSIKDILTRNDIQDIAKKYGYYNDTYEFINKEIKNVNVRKIHIKNDKKSESNHHKSDYNNNKINFSRPSSAITRKNNSNLNKEVKYSFNSNINEKKDDYGVVRIPKFNNINKKKIKITPSAKNIKNSKIKISREKIDNPMINPENINKMIEEFERQQKINIEKEKKEKEKDKENEKEIKKEDNKIFSNKYLNDEKNKEQSNINHPKISHLNNLSPKQYEIKQENKKDYNNIMDYKSSDFFNNLNKIKPVIIKETKEKKPDESLLGIFLSKKEENKEIKEIKENKEIKIKEESNKNENLIKNDLYTESSLGISNLNSLINDYGKTRELVRTRDKPNIKKDNNEKDEFAIIENEEINRKNQKHNTEKINNKNIKSKTIDSDSDEDITDYNRNFNDDDDSDKEEEDVVFVINKEKKEKKENKEDEKNKVIKCIDELKVNLKELIGEKDYNFVTKILNKLNEDEVYTEIEDFFNKNYPEEKKEEVRQIYLRLIINTFQLNKLNKIE